MRWWMNMELAGDEAQVYDDWLNLDYGKPALVRSMRWRGPGFAYASSPAPWRFLLGVLDVSEDGSVKPALLLKNVVPLSSIRLVPGRTTHDDHDWVEQQSLFHNPGIGGALAHLRDG